MTDKIEEPAEKPLKTILGTVVSDKMHKTVVVQVERRVPHPMFRKLVRRTTKYYAHDENGEAKIGDTVEIVGTRPLSKLKRHRLLKVVKK
jgi:small subunit ribosomal protein S17